MAEPAARSTDARVDRATTIAMLVNAIVIALMLCASVLSDIRAPISGDRHWRSPQAEPPAFDPFRELEILFDPIV